MNNLDTILLACASPYTIGQIAQSPRGWEVTLWSGQIGYSSYACATATNLRSALSSAATLLSLGGTELESNLPVIRPAGLDALFTNLRSRLTANQPKLTRRI